MSDRDAVIFVITSDKNQTFNEAIIQEKEVIMKVMKFDRYADDVECGCSPSRFFDSTFLQYNIHYVKYTPDYKIKKLYSIGKGESFVAIFSRNSAGSWEGIQVIPARSGLSTNVRYYTFQETICLPS